MRLSKCEVRNMVKYTNEYIANLEKMKENPNNSIDRDYVLNGLIATSKQNIRILEKLNK